MFFYETQARGKWWPVLSRERPVTKAAPGGRLRLRTSEGVRNEVRCVTDVPPYLDHLTLDQVQALFGADGQLRGTARGLV